jgi:hypothetical protein
LLCALLFFFFFFFFGFKVGTFLGQQRHFCWDNTA